MTNARNPVLSIRVGPLTRTQLDELQTRWGMSLATVITVLADRAHQQETRTMTTDTNSIQTMTLEQLTYAVFHAAYPDSYGEPNPDKIAEIGEWLSGPGGWADYADAESLAAEWRQVEAEAEWATE
jgi:hypothetical protein